MAAPESPLRVGIVGAGRIGGNCARRFALAGHEVRLSFSRDIERLRALASDIGEQASVGSPADAVSFADVVVLAVPWDAIGMALEQSGNLDERIVIDTTNQFGSVELPPPGSTAATHNATRMPGARYTKSFNTLTAAFQAAVAGRPIEERVVQWLCGDDPDAKATTARLIYDAGYTAVDLGGTCGCQIMEAPRRAGAVYGEEYRLADARAVRDALRAGRPLPPPPSYT